MAATLGWILLIHSASSARIPPLTQKVFLLLENTTASRMELWGPVLYVSRGIIPISIN